MYGSRTKRGAGVPTLANRKPDGNPGFWGTPITHPPFNIDINLRDAAVDRKSSTKRQESPSITKLTNLSYVQPKDTHYACQSKSAGLAQLLNMRSKIFYFYFCCFIYYN